MSCKLCLFFNFFVPKAYVFESCISLSFVGSPFSIPNQKMTLVTLNRNFHIDLWKFVSDWTCIIQRLKW